MKPPGMVPKPGPGPLFMGLVLSNLPNISFPTIAPFFSSPPAQTFDEKYVFLLIQSYDQATIQNRYLGMERRLRG